MAPFKEEKFLESRSQVVELVNDAGVSDQNVTMSQPVGYGNLQVRNASVLDNFPHLSVEMSSAAQRLMREATGVYRGRRWQTFNPLYWVEFLIYLPREVLGSYMGVESDRIRRIRKETQESQEHLRMLYERAEERLKDSE